MSRRVGFYFDGFNFYNGLREQKRKDRRWAEYYWIDLVKFCQQFIDPTDVLVKVKYFTAPPLNPQKQARQSLLFHVNKMLNPDLFEVVQGKYYQKNIGCPNCHTVFQRPEEKRTDVNISVQMIGDCSLDLVDTLILVTGDSDLVPPVQFIGKHFPNQKLKIYFPPCRTSADLFSVAEKKVVYLENNRKKFEAAVMPHQLVFNGKTYTIPSKWVV